ncbi:MAG: hypothetical protein J1F61_03290 [Clostridiales bacterium]|nr:hypothetical protein [Clostridiales bacterium]
MNKKRIFAGIAAVATALTMCFALSACNSCGGRENISGDGSVKSEESWIKAFEDSVAATNYKFVQKTMSTGKIYDKSADYARTSIVEVGYDGAGLKAYSKSEKSEQIGNVDPTLDSGISYFEVSDSTLINYQYNEDDGWYAAVDEYDTQDEAKENFEQYVSGLLGSIIRTKYNGTGDKQEVSGTLGELYSLFSYNSKTNVYSATLSAAADFEISIKISFKNGKIYKSVRNYVREGITTRIEDTITYGGVSITIPQGAKDALESMSALIFVNL